MRRVTLILIALAAVLWAAPARAAAPPRLDLGVSDGVYMTSDSRLRSTALDRTVSVGASIVRLPVEWSAIAPVERPAGFDAANPDDASYRWSALDEGVRDAEARGLRVLITVSRAPLWAEAPGAPAGAIRGTWKPSAAELGRFGLALARRYSGAHPDPGRPGSALPKVTLFQAWNEPNLAEWLAPQFRRSGGRVVPASPEIYRRLLNAFFAAVKSVQPGATVVTAGTAPYGDLRWPGRRLAPATFVRELLCLSRSLQPSPCSSRARFDVLAHQPYGGAPGRHALNRDDVAVRDLRRLVRPLRRAERRGLILPQGRHRIWCTELSWDSSPPDPEGVPEQIHARWISQALSLLWQQGVDTVVWFQITDAPPVPSFAASFQSGLFLRDGTEKAAARSFRFPFAVRGHGSRLAVWGRAPRPGPVTIERRVRAVRSRTVTLRANSGGIFSGRIGGRGRGTVTARQGAAVSNVWPVAR